MEASGMQSSVSSNSSEVVYGTHSASSIEENRVMSDKVQALASSIYKQFETMILKHGDDSVKDLMPLVVHVLESLDLAYLEKEEQAVEMEMIRDDNEQLVTQYEREKQQRKAQDQKCLELEESTQEQSRELESKIQSLESIVRMLELKAKNSNDHAQRLEERESAQKEEFEKLHHRYNELLRTHIEHVERTKYLMGPDKFDMMQSLPMPAKNKFAGMATSVDTNIRGISDIISAVHMSQSTHADVNLANHISNERDWQEEFGQSDLITSPRDDFNDQASREDAKSIKDEADNQNVDEGDREPEDSLAADLTGMGREVENLIKENNELLETKNALNIVKNDLIARLDELSSESEILREDVRSLEMVKMKMSNRIQELEADLKDAKEKARDEEVDTEDDVPMAQRKRFTRVEMARVLMERNQYKEKLMELEDAVKFTEMQRAKRMNTASQNQPRSKIWDFFSELIGGSPATTPGHAPVRRTNKRATDANLRRKAHARNYDLDLESVQEKRMAERRQQYRAVSQHMKKEDDTRTQAYGWSIPVTVDTASSSANIPVPICCRPLLDRQPSLKIWCAAGVALHGGKTKDGGYIVGDSVFYADVSNLSPDEASPPDTNRVDLLDFEIRQQQREKYEQEFSIWECSSLIWVCSSNERRSFVTILDANNPNNVIECFNVGEAHLLSVSSVAGVRESDYPAEDDNSKEYNREGGYVKDLPADVGEHETFGAVTWVELRRSDVNDIPTYCSVDEKTSPRRERNFSVSEANPEGEQKDEIATDIPKPAPKEPEVSPSDLVSPRTTLPLEKRVTFADEEPAGNKEERALRSWVHLQPHIRDGLSKYEGVGEITTALPTMWMGLENDYIYIHSGVSEWRKCLRRIKMPDAVLHILHYKGRVFAALANGTIAVFVRDANGCWDDTGYHLIKFGKATSAVCHLIVVAGRIWAAYRNCVVVVDPKELKVESAFVAHPRRDSQIRNMVWVGDGVWLSIRLDSTIRLYHAHTYQHLQDVDIEPYITQMLGSNKLDFLHLRITSLLVLNRRLWIGTGTGVIVSVPLSEENNTKVEVSKVDIKKPSGEEVRGPGGLIRVYGNPNSDRVSPGSFIPYCNMTHAQLSFHGHKDAVRFFLPVPADSNPAILAESQTRKILMVSGGDGYIDFRLGEEDEPPNASATKDQVRVHDMSHLIAWELEVPNLSKRL
uniref:JNK-interacting protein n=1 Tax=Panagrellus redivivus TaxID=6233 RepID=A0A7E4W6I5_PANRE